MTHLVPVLRPVLGTPFRRGDLYRRAGEVPSFHIAPARTGHARDLITGSVLGTYNSASPAWAVGPDGVLALPAANAPVIEYDPVTLACLGARIWGVVTNLLLRSEEFTAAAWISYGSVIRSANTTISPSNTLTADSVTLSASSGIYQSIAASSNTTYTFSVWIRADSAQSVYCTINTNLGDYVSTSFAITTTWRRLVISKTTSAGTTVLTVQIDANSGGTVFVWGAQVNTGTLGPYVPTTTTAASSTADVWSITGADFSRIWNQSAGTVYGDGNSTAGPFLAARATATSSNRIQFGPDNVQSAVIDGGAIQYISPTGAGKRAMAFAVNDFAQQIQGQSINTDPSGTVPSVDYMTLGRYDFGGGEFLDGYIRELAIFRSRRPNSNLQAMTS